MKSGPGTGRGVRAAEEAAFGRPDEAAIVDALAEITNRWGIEDPAWMVRGELSPGEVRYAAAFGP